MRNWFTQTDWGALGRGLVEGIIAGINNAASALWETATNLINEALERIRQAINPGSPSRTTFPWGVSVGEGLIAGVRSTFAAAGEVMEQLFARMSDVAGLGGGFGSEFRRRVIDPLTAGLGRLTDEIGQYDQSIAEMVEQLGYQEGFENRPDAILELMRRANYEHATERERNTARTLIAFLRERQRLTLEQIEAQRELARQQERLAALEEKRAQIGFLQQQLDLIKLIKDNNLSANILEGLTLGLNADPGALMDAMAAAMRQMIAAAEQELGIASASKVFRRIAAQAKQGLIVELADSRAVVRAARGMARNMAESAELALARAGVGAAGLGGAADSSRRLTMYGGQHFYFQQRRGSVLDEVQGLLRP